jgi:parvulin-like peptidyl-prolyl isomerase
MHIDHDVPRLEPARLAGALLILTLSFGALAAQQPAAPPTQEGATPRDVATPEAVAVVPHDEDVLVRLGDETLTRDAFEREFEVAARATAMQQGLEPTPDVLASFLPFREMLLEQLATQMVLVQHAREVGVSVEAEAVDEVMERMRTAQGGDADAYASYLETAGFSDEVELRALIERSMTVQRVIEALSADIEVHDDDVEAWYDAHPEQVSTPQGVVPLEAVREEIVALLVRERVDARVEELVANAPLEIFPDRL